MRSISLVSRESDTVGHQRGSTDSVERLACSSASQKIERSHLDRVAIVYVRQSTLSQVAENRESTSRQYALADSAVRLGWPGDRIHIIDEDQGLSGRSAEERCGFKRLLMEVTLDHVGLVLGLEMSRLARSSKDWHHLLELCAIFGTLLGDQDGVYDPRDPNDRLLLGLKGTISELELHTMRNRLEKGKLHKAQRGELFFDAPIGYVKTANGQLALDPDEEARSVVALIFDKFDELGTVYAVLRYLSHHDIRLGVRIARGAQRGELEWRRPCRSTLFAMLHHPFYAGTYAYGRRTLDRKRNRTGRRGKGTRFVPMQEWKVVLHDHLPAYITRDRYLRNQERLCQNQSRANAAGIPRRGVALLGGIVFCGRCGTRLRVTYSRTQQARYECVRHTHRGIERTCHSVAASVIDTLVVQQVLRAVQPASLELSLRAGDNVQLEREQLARHWAQQRERAHYAAAKAERHYRAVDPENRLVARTLEHQWEQALRAEQQLEEEYGRFLQQAPHELTRLEKERICALATDIPALWNSPATTVTDRKELVRCLLDQVSVAIQGSTEMAEVTLRWKGGFVSEHQLVRPVRKYIQLRDHKRLIDRARELREAGQSAAEIAEHLNKEGFHTGRNFRFTKRQLRQLMKSWGWSDSLDDEHVLRPNEWRLGELARLFDLHPSKLRRWIRQGWVRARRPRAVWSHIIWADSAELDRLARMRDFATAHPQQPYPVELTQPQAAQKPLPLK